ncbi:MAG: hypothetical protein H6889_00085 [Brucellaceae bacterium]|nr:hypothetical protein [Notoacmeibacter sp.]MCC0025375.1 hypothetical protein [Brucellaceae bacterium]
MRLAAHTGFPTRPGRCDGRHAQAARPVLPASRKAARNPRAGVRRSAWTVPDPVYLPLGTHIAAKWRCTRLSRPLPCR